MLNTSEKRISRTMGLPETLAGQKTLCDRLTGKRLAVRGESITVALGAGEGIVIGIEEGRQK